MAAGLNCCLAVVDGATALHSKTSQARHLYFDVQHHHQNFHAFCQRLHTVSARLFHFILHAGSKPRPLRHNGKSIWQVPGDDDWRVRV